ncbi:hypothetical protein JW988_01185 [Candidatus Bathyarchaeota archaeon]|nr:hypothetical protein [Candidatus Bathyarchaeota archaeon]
MKLKNIRIISVIPIVTAVLTAGCRVTDVHMGLGILTIVFAAVTTLGLFTVKE